MGEAGGGGTNPADASASPSDAPAGADAEDDASGAAPDATPGKNLRIYWVDVEGGASTVIVTPEGEVLVVDTGFPGTRDANRITQLLREEVKTERIDFLITTHFDGDHVGGATRLADAFEVTRFIDRGSGDAQGYAAAAQGKRMGVQAGDRVALKGDIELVFVVGNGTVIDAPLAGNEPNPHCAGRTPGGRQMNEDGRSLGYRLKWGTFEFVDLGDLLGGFQHDLACPVNKVGQVDLMQIVRHGQNGSSEPQLINALSPLVVVSNNSANKGADGPAFTNVKNIPGLQGLWQLHTKSSAGVPADQIANPSGDPAHFISATIEPGGAFTITNARNDFSKTYQAR